MGLQFVVSRLVSQPLRPYEGRVVSGGVTQEGIGAATMRESRMNTAPEYHSWFVGVSSFQSEMRNGMEEVVGSIPTRSTKIRNNYLRRRSREDLNCAEVSCLATPSPDWTQPRIGERYKSPINWPPFLLIR